MSRILASALAVVLTLAVLVNASAPPPKSVMNKAAVSSDRLDFVFLASDSPVLMRFHVRIGDRPYDAAWSDFMDRLFTWFDKDKNGSLSPIETARLCDANSLRNHIQGSIGANTQTVPMATIDTNKDGKVSKEEFRAYYRKNGFPGFRFDSSNGQAMQAVQVNKALLKRLDRDGDGKLSADEVAGMYEKLRSLDENEDEIITESELNTRNDSGIYLDSVAKMPQPVAVKIEPGLLAVVPGQEANVVRQIIARYDRNKDGKLTCAEIGLDKSVFDALDRNHDGFLSAGEAQGLFTRSPDFVLRLQLGTPGSGKGLLSRLGLGPILPTGPRIVVVNEKTIPAPLKKKMNRRGGNLTEFQLGDTHLSLQVNASFQSQRRFNGASNFYLNQFSTIAGKKGYVTREDQKGNQPYLFQIFSQADQDANGKLTRKELLSWLDLVTSGMNVNAVVAANDLGRGLFPALDPNHDGRLSLREMMTAWKRLKPLSKDGKTLAHADIPRAMSVVVSEGDNNGVLAAPVAFGGSMGTPAGRGAVGPVPAWFRKMDRNNDGDISIREWLGSEADFKAMDLDGDGLISPAEASQFEAKRKTAKR